MKKRFNVDGICYPDEHYMVDIEDRLEQIHRLIEDEKYFVINWARQYADGYLNMDLVMESNTGFA